MRGTVGEALISLREILDAGIQAVDERDDGATDSRSKRIDVDQVGAARLHTKCGARFT